MVSLGDRLREERERLGLNQTQFGDLAAVTKKTQMLYEGDQRSPKADYLTAIAQAGVDVQYLLTGNRSVLGASGAQAAYRVEDGTPIGLGAVAPGSAVPVKMYDIEAAAGAGRSLEDETVKTTIYFPAEQLQALGLAPGRVAGVQVRGDSMEGTLEDGDWALVDLDNRDPRQEGVFLLLVSGERRIKRVQRLAGGALYLISDNEHYQPEMIPPQQMREVEILGRCEVRIGRIS